MKIRVKDLMDITLAIRYDKIFVIEPNTGVYEFNTLLNHDMNELLKCTETIEHFWVSKKQMFIVIE